MYQKITTFLRTPYSLPLLIGIVLLFGISIRLILAFYTHDSAWHTINGEFISILSADPALYGYYANLLLDNLPHTTNVSLIEYLLYAIVKTTSLSLDSVLYFGPALFASLVAVPVVLILRLYISSFALLFFLGVLSTVGYGYYSRTYLGYFDTDVLNTFFPLMILYSMLLIIKKEDFKFALLGAFLNMLYLFWYHSSEPLIYALNGMFVLFCLIFYFKQAQFYKASILLAFSVLPLFFGYKLALLALLFFLFYLLKINYKYYVALFGIAFIFVLYKLDVSLISFHLNRYLFKEELFQTQGYHFLFTMNLVAESISYDISKFIELSSGNIFIFIFSLLGYFILCYKHKEALLLLPMLGLGLLGLEAGIRFFIYGVPVLIIGFGYFLFICTDYFKNKFLSYSIVAILLLNAFYATYQSVYYWNTKIAVPIFSPQQVEVLRAVKQQAKSSDFFVTWWDYGWPLWYYTNMKTLIDNGKHHQDNFVVSSIFMSNSQAFSNHAVHLFYETYKKRGGTAINGVIKEHKDLNKVLKELETTDLVKKKTSEKYIFIPFQMLETFYTMYQFSNLDINTGEKYPKNIYLERTFQKEDDFTIYFNEDSYVDKVNGLFVENDEKYYIKNIHTVTQKGREKKIAHSKGHEKGLEVILYNKKFYIMDDKFFNSLFTQLFFFDNYDERYFEQLFSTDQMKLYRVK